MINKDEQAEQSQVDAKISDLRASILHLSEKLQSLLDVFLDGVLERDDYTKKKAEILSQKKTLEEQASDLSMGTLEWVEPLRNMLEKAVSICKIAKGADQEAKKSLLLEIFGLNLKLKNKNVVAFSDSKYKSPKKIYGWCFAPPKKKSPDWAIILKFVAFWSHDRGLNPRPHPYHGCALPTELSRHESLLILTYLPRSRQATSGGGFSCWLSIRVSADSVLRTLPVAPRRCRLPSKLLRIRQQSSRPSGFAVYLGASVIRLEPAQ